MIDGQPDSSNICYRFNAWFLIMCLGMVLGMGLSGCMANFYSPKTAAGVACKKECATAMLACRASSYTCDKGYNRCTDSCEEGENLKP